MAAFQETPNFTVSSVLIRIINAFFGKYISFLVSVHRDIALILSGGTDPILDLCFMMFPYI